MADALRGKRTVVVGASAGIGRAVAEQAIAAGADVVLVGRRAERLEELRARAGNGHCVAADLTEPDDCARLVREAIDALGSIDALLFCSGASRLSALRETTQDEWRYVFDVNVIGPSLVTAAALPYFTPGAFVGFLSSESVGRPRHGLVHYSASKIALEETIRGWRTEHPQFRFCCLCVGATDSTEFAREFDTDVAMALFPKWLSHGHMAAALMPIDQVAGSLLDVVANALAHPGVDVQEVTIRPPGPLLEGPIDSLLEGLEESQATAKS